ncbi:MAG: hypothetical protein FD133_1446 [Erysipelotrichaceae bacterium]|nr:MAG: hypothetical protein FD179_1275 [Erysipelotrichaceae bacterium]TXT17318.1 MAG: hypothetical protein FD133_1446 [Erysipelotrichaceae bacterium]
MEKNMSDDGSDERKLAKLIDLKRWSSRVC